jgi:predicted nucleic-acid-binding Zn-ribbon protein
MNEEKKCLRCSSTNLTDGDFQSTGKIYSRPKNAKMSMLCITGVLVDSIICLDCGYLELNVNPDKVKLITKNLPNPCSPAVSCKETSGHDFSSDHEDI